MTALPDRRFHTYKDAWKFVYSLTGASTSDADSVRLHDWQVTAVLAPVLLAASADNWSSSAVKLVLRNPSEAFTFGTVGDALSRHQPPGYADAIRDFSRLFVDADGKRLSWRRFRETESAFAYAEKLYSQMLNDRKEVLVSGSPPSQ